MGLLGIFWMVVCMRLKGTFGVFLRTQAGLDFWLFLFRQKWVILLFMGPKCTQYQSLKNHSRTNAYFYLSLKTGEKTLISVKFYLAQNTMEKSRVYNSIAVKMPKRKQREDEEPSRKRQFLGR